MNDPRSVKPVCQQGASRTVRRKVILREKRAVGIESSMRNPFILSLTIPGVPVAKGRPKLSTRGGFARAYTPAKTRHYEDLISCEAADVMGDRPPLDEPVSVTVTAYIAAPKALKGQKRLDAMDGLLKPVTRPDLDNYAKAALDGCNAIIFRDDSLVTDLIVRKRYSERPRLTITIETGADFA